MNELDVVDAGRLLSERREEDRRSFFKAMGAGGILLVTGGVVAACGSSTPTAPASPAPAPPSSAGDISILNLALTAEYLAVDFYQMAIGSGKSTTIPAAVLTNFKGQEQQHVDALTAAIKQMSGAAAAKPTFTYPSGTFDSPDAIVKTALALEAAFVGAYLGALAKLSSADLKKAAATIGFVEGEHRVYIRELAGMQPYVDLAFEKPISADQAKTAVGMFVKS